MIQVIQQVGDDEPNLDLMRPQPVSTSPTRFDGGGDKLAASFLISDDGRRAASLLPRQAAASSHRWLYPDLIGHASDASNRSADPIQIRQPSSIRQPNLQQGRCWSRWI
ncbi:hypothetical protein ACLOJK_004004 [Asimina triloba]